MHTLIIGAGFSGLHIAVHAKEFGTACGTRRSREALSELHRNEVETLVLSGLESDSELDSHSNPLSDDFLHQLTRATHLVICSAPYPQAPLNDPVLRLFTHDSVHMPKLEWIGYLSTIGVYGDHHGGWVDESTPCTSIQSRSIMRREAELGWQAFAGQQNVPLTLLRLSGIYGPSRNAVEDAIAGRARVLTKANQVFNRIHVDDLATATLKAGRLRYNGIVNISDDLPAAPEEVVYYAHTLVGKPNPPAIDIDSADVSEMARSFYSECKRVRNTRSKEVLGMQYKYPTYRDGMDALWAEFRDSDSSPE